MEKPAARPPKKPNLRSEPKADAKPDGARSKALRDAPIPPGDEVGAAELTARVAANLRDHRRKRDMSLDQLAQRTGVSRAGLSQIETCKTNPSIGVLWKIAAGLGIPFADLLGEKEQSISTLRRVDAQVLRSTDRKFESRPLMPGSGAGPIEVYELLLSARARHTSDPHGPNTRELVVVLSGALRMIVGDQVEELGPGDSMLFNANLPHVYENPGSSEARYHDIIIYPLR
jgi:transcriptional regulator with XRE-family HTH domain